MALVRDAAYRFNERGANSLPLADLTIVYQHAALGLSGGRVRPLQSGDRFAGFAGRRVDNRALAAGAPAVNVPIIASGSVDLLVPGVAATDVGLTVYASDDNTFGLSGLRAVGSISSVVGTDVARVEFDALGAASSVSGDGQRDLPKLLPFGCSISQQCNAFLNNTTSTTTAAVLARANVLPVANGGLYTGGNIVSVPLYNGRIFTTTVASVAGNNVTISDRLPAMVRSGSAVTLASGGAEVPQLNMGYGAINAAVALLGGPVEVLPAYGYGGALCVQMIADLERDLRHYRPQFVGLHMFENDLTGTVAGGGATIDQMKAWARVCARLCLAYGAVPIVYSSMPYWNGASVGIPASRAADYDALAEYVGSGATGQLSRDVPGALGDNSVSYAWLDTSNPTWPRAPVAGVTDGVHPLVNRRFYVGTVARPVLESAIGRRTSHADYFVTPLGRSRLEGTGGSAPNMQAGSIAPTGYTISAFGGVVASSVRGASGGLAFTLTWPGAATLNTDYLYGRYPFTVPDAWRGAQQRFRVIARFRLTARSGLSRIACTAVFNSGETFSSTTGGGFVESMPVDTEYVLETPVFGISAATTTVTVGLEIQPITAGSPSGAVCALELLELGVVICTPETPHTFV